MGLIPQVKCGRCDRTYSGLRSRCPYCGAHRHKKGKRVSDGDNATWKLIIGILLIVVLIAAVIVILVTSPKGDDEGGSKSTGDDNNPGYVPGNDPGDTKGEQGQIAVTDANGAAVASLTLKVGEIVDLNAAVEAGSAVPVWTSSDEAVVKVEAVDETGLKARVTGANNGSAVVTVTSGETKTDIPVTCGETTPPETTPGGDTPGGSTTPSSTVASKIVVYKNSKKTAEADDFSLNVGEKWTLYAVITPSSCTSVPVWTSENTDIYQIVADETGLKAVAYCVGSGTTKINVTVDGVTYTCIVRGRKG